MARGKLDTQVPIVCRKWINASDVVALYPRAHWAAVRQLMKADTWPSKVDPLDKRGVQYVERDAFDQWVAEHGLPTYLTKGRVVCEPATVAWREKYVPDLKYVLPPPKLVQREELRARAKTQREKRIHKPTRAERVEASVEAAIRAEVEAAREERSQPRRMIADHVLLDIMTVITGWGGPSGDGDDADELRRVISRWVQECYEEPARPEFWA